MEFGRQPDDGHLDLPPPERDTPIRALARVVSGLLAQPLMPDREDGARVHRLLALAEANEADRHFAQLMEAVLDGDAVELGSCIEIPAVLDEEHVRRVLQKWISLNVNCVANLIEVGDAIRHAPETVSTNALDTFTSMVAESQASIARSLQAA